GSHAPNVISVHPAAGETANRPGPKGFSAFAGQARPDGGVGSAGQAGSAALGSAYPDASARGHASTATGKIYPETSARGLGSAAAGTGSAHSDAAARGLSPASAGPGGLTHPEGSARAGGQASAESFSSDLNFPELAGAPGSANSEHTGAEPATPHLAGSDWN